LVGTRKEEKSVDTFTTEVEAVMREEGATKPETPASSGEKEKVGGGVIP